MSYIRLVMSVSLFTFIALLSACGGGGNSTSSESTVSAFVSKGPVEGASCVLYSATDSTKPLAGPVTSSNGHVDFVNVPTLSAGQIVWISCTGGTYVDEATGHSTNLATTMRGAGVASDGATSVVITPLSELAVAKAKAISDDFTSVVAEAQKVAHAFGIPDVDVLSTTPTDVNNAPADSSAAGQYGTLLAALSQLQQAASGALSLGDLMTQLGNGYADGKIDGTLVTKLNNALAAISSGTTVGDYAPGPDSKVANNSGGSGDSGASHIPSNIVATLTSNLISGSSGGGSGGGSGGSSDGSSDGSSGGSSGGGSGAFWSTFTVADPGCVKVGNAQVCGPSQINRIEVDEPSTGEALGTCDFSSSNTATTGTAASRGWEFTCELTPGANGGGTIKVSSAQANLPLIHAYHIRISDKLPMWETYTNADGGVLHGADGATYTDPYQNKQFQFAGYKEFSFKTVTAKSYADFRKDAYTPLYNAYQGSGSGSSTVDEKPFTLTNPGYVGVVDVMYTLDGRAKIADVLGSMWMEVSSETKGNKGTYTLKVKYQGNGKATMTFPFSGSKVWENTIDNATFEYDHSETQSGTTALVLRPTSGTVTATNYVLASGCVADPASFTDTYTLVKGNAYLYITLENPPRYSIGGTLGADINPIQGKTYTLTCPGGMGTSTETMEPGAQEHMLFLQNQLLGIGTDGTIKGSYTNGSNSDSYNWNLTPADN